MSDTRLPVRRLTFGPDAAIDPSLEWIVTNGLGGYASGPVRGGVSRRFHGPLVAALPAPLGRILCLSHLRVTAMHGERPLVVDHERLADLSGVEIAAPTDFTLDGGLPAWRYRLGSHTLEKRVVMPFGQNTTHLLFTLPDEGTPPLTLRFQPMFNVRPHEGLVSQELAVPQSIDIHHDCVQLEFGGGLPDIRWCTTGDFTQHGLQHEEKAAVSYAIEEARGYDHIGSLWTPGWIDVNLSHARGAAFTISTEPWHVIRALSADETLANERTRREGLLVKANGQLDPVAAELIIAADQFIVSPVGRVEEIVRARAIGETAPRTVVAGYHWFTDWGRDTMISLEGLTLATGRAPEAARILATFAHYVRDGLIPNMFPEGEREGLYHTADATLWFFHAVHRYVQRTGDRDMLAELLPTLVEIAARHCAGTHFGIGVDADGLLTQGAEGYQLTWMDAKVGDWVVTPRRGKAVEINALWYNALRLLEGWLEDCGNREAAAAWHQAAACAFDSFNRRFWNDETGWLFDVVDGPDGDDPACRPNQLFSIALDHPILERRRWPAVLGAVRQHLLTPLGLRSLSPEHPAYQRTYQGELRARDAAYHQGTVWAWLIGPFVDAWMKTYPEERDQTRAFLSAFPGELERAGVGSISEIFDAEPPYTPRGCIAQAWSVAEVLRAWRRTA